MRGIAAVFGGSRGIGYAVSERLLHEGYEVAVISRNSEDAVRKLAESYGCVSGYNADASSEPDIKAVYRDIEEKYGHLDAVVNSVGVLDFRTLYDSDEESFTKMFRTNVFSLLLICRNAVPLLERSTLCPSIVNISAVGSIAGGGRSPIYRASKAAFSSLSEAFAESMARKGNGIRVNTVCPSKVLTDMSRMLGESNDEQGGYMKAEDIADIVYFLISSEARVLNGCSILAKGKDFLSRYCEILG